jgi:hypothetical protein
MEYGIETVWRKGLQARGKEWVLSELHRRPGQPDDVLYDVVFKEPYPTRAFCFQWCAEEENTVFRMSWHTYATLIVLALLIVSILKGISAWNDETASVNMLQAQTTAGGGGAASGGGGGGASGSTSNVAIPSMSTSPSTINTSTGSTLSSPGTTVSGSGTTSSTSSGDVITSPSGSTLTTGLSAPASICGYITYDSPRCPQQN